MKPSAWNREMRVDGDLILFNGLTQAILRIDPEKEEKVKRIIRSERIEESADEDIRILKKGGYITEDDFDETDHLISKFNNYKYTDELLRFTIVMTTACNFSCTYCYQNQLIPLTRKGTPRSFPDETADDVLAVTERYFESRKPKTLSVTFYGGEPLLELEKMVRLSEGFKDLCEKHDVFYDPFIVTNGYLLDGKTAERISDVGIKSVIITIDGKKDFHDRYRVLKDGKGTYDKLIGNILGMQDTVHVQVRTNVSKDSVPSVKEMVREFAGRKLKVSFDFQIVEIVPGAPHSFGDRTLTLEEFAALETELYEEILELFPDYRFNPFKKMRFARCDALCRNSFVVEPDGRLFKCWGEVGSSDKNVGTIREGRLELNHRLESWTSWNPFGKCDGCEVFPLCMGGCVFNAVVAEKLHASPVEKPQSTCIPLKYNLEDMVKLVVRNEMKKRAGREA